MWEFMALIFTEFTKLAQRMGVRDVFTVPSKEIIDFPNDRHRNMQGVAYFGFGNVSLVEIKPSEFQTWLGYCQYAEECSTFQTFECVVGISCSNLVEDNLRNDTVKFGHGVLPPFTSHFLACRNDDVPTRTGNEVT